MLSYPFASNVISGVEKFMLKLKYLLKNRKKVIKDFKRIHSIDYKDGNIYLLNTPEHGNLGDHAIAEATLEFMKNNFPGHTVIEVTHDQFLMHKKWLKRKIAKNSLILVHGGGYLGDLWRNEQECFFSILHLFSDHHIIVFPQTIYYRVKELLNSDKIEYSKFRNLSVFLRDRSSYNLAKNTNLFGDNHFYLCPDIVFSWKYSKHENDRNGVLLCFRSDLEKVLDSSLVGEIKHSLKQQDIPFFETDTVLPANIPIDQRNSELNRKLSQFQTSKLVITDRLHGMLFAAITGTPCIALDNVSKKVSGAYNWIKTEENILCLQDDQSDTASIIKTINQFYKTAVPNYEIDINLEFLNLKKIIGDIL